MFEQLWIYKQLKHHNFLALCIWEKVILNCNEKLYFLLCLYFYLLRHGIFFHSGYVIIYLLTISALTDICFLHGRPTMWELVSLQHVIRIKCILALIRCMINNKERQLHVLPLRDGNLVLYNLKQLSIENMRTLSSSFKLIRRNTWSHGERSMLFANL